MHSSTSSWIVRDIILAFISSETRFGFAASQYERSFTPKRLNNWEVPDDSKLAQDRFGVLQPRTGKTKTIVQDNGHLKPGLRKPGVTSFTDTKEAERPVYAASKPRWPTKNVSWEWAPRAGRKMGYKGIETDYLRRTTVPVKTYMTGGKDFNFLH